MLLTYFRNPSPALAPFVRFYVERQVQLGSAVVVHPVAARTCPMLGFYFRDRINVSEGPQQVRISSRAVLVGLQTHRRLEMLLTGNLHSFYIMFCPGGLHRLFSLPMDEITDRDYDAHSVLGHLVPRLEERLEECGSVDERVHIMEKSLLNNALNIGGIDSIYASAGHMLDSAGRAVLPSLASKAGLSLRQFERRFIKQVGVRPKLFTRMARFEAALERKARFVDQSWTQIAHEFGYHDQMHMIHDFAEFTGGSPSTTLTQLEKVFVESLQSIRRGNVPKAGDANPRLIF